MVWRGRPRPRLLTLIAAPRGRGRPRHTPAPAKSAELRSAWTGRRPVPTRACSRPERAVQRAVLDGFGDVFGLDGGGAFEVGDRAGYL